MATGFVLDVNGQQFPITERSVLIGRGSENQINLSDSEASRRHASVQLIQGIPYISDLGSRNGTFVNDERVRRDQMLQNGDRIKIGNTFLTVRVGAVSPNDAGRIAIVAGALVGALIIVLGLVILLQTRSTATPAAFTGAYIGDRGSPTYTEIESGVMVDPRGFILTRAKPLTAGGCVPGSVIGSDVAVGQISAIERAPEVFYAATVYCADPGADLVLLEVVATVTGGPLPPDVRFNSISIGDSDSLEVGDKLSIIGFTGPGNPVPITVRAGIVSAFVPGPQGLRTWIASNVALEPGMTGGMAINGQGQLVGIVVPTFANCTPSCLAPVNSAPVRGLLSRVP